MKILLLGRAIRLVLAASLPSRGRNFVSAHSDEIFGAGRHLAGSSPLAFRPERMIRSAFSLALLAAFSLSYCSRAAIASSAGESLLVQPSWRCADGAVRRDLSGWQQCACVRQASLLFEPRAALIFSVSLGRSMARSFQVSLGLFKRLRRQLGAGCEGRERMEGVGLTRPHGRIVVIDRENRSKWIVKNHVKAILNVCRDASGFMGVDQINIFSFAPTPRALFRQSVVGGTCAGYAKPHWQTLVGNPGDGVRDLPDVSLFASAFVWKHYYIYCFSDTSSPLNSGRSCAGTPDTWANAGGTSFAAPIWAGIQALANQAFNGPSGNPNYVLYTLARQEYGSLGSSKCNSSLGNTVDPSCIFYDVTLGDMNVECEGPYDCYTGGGQWGVLSTSDTTLSPAYGTSTGWDFATGIGTVNVWNLVQNWPPPPSCFRIGNYVYCD